MQIFGKKERNEQKCSGQRIKKTRKDRTCSRERGKVQVVVRGQKLLENQAGWRQSHDLGLSSPAPLLCCCGIHNRMQGTEGVGMKWKKWMLCLMQQLYQSERENYFWQCIYINIFVKHSLEVHHSHSIYIFFELLLLWTLTCNWINDFPKRVMRLKKKGNLMRQKPCTSWCLCNHWTNVSGNLY